MRFSLFSLAVLVYVSALAGQRHDIEGFWSSECYPLPKRHSIIFQTKFHKGQVLSEAFQFADSTCQLLNLKVLIQGNYELGKKWGQGHEFNLRAQNVAVEVYNSDALDYFNLKKACGIGDWKLNERREIFERDCDPTVFPNFRKPGLDIYRVVHGNLIFGKFPFELAQERPLSLNPTFPLKKNGVEIVTFKNGDLTLHGYLYKPKGKGPFPTVLYNHGSAKKMLSNTASEILGPLFVSKGWAFFMPYRRGQGLSFNAGTYIGKLIGDAEDKGGLEAGQREMVRLLTTDHLEDQLAALNWLKTQKFVDKARMAVQGNSFGGIETVLGAQREPFCAAVDASGGAQSWEPSPDLHPVMEKAVAESQSPIFFFQAQNDYNLSPSFVLSQTMNNAGKINFVKIYPAFGKSQEEGHSFTYLGSAIWEKDVFKFLNTYCPKPKAP